MVLGVGVIWETGIAVVARRAAAQSAGPAMAFACAVAVVAAGTAALYYAEMTSMLPISGSATT